MFKRDAKSADAHGGRRDDGRYESLPIFTLGTAKSDPRLDWAWEARTCFDLGLPLQDEFGHKCWVELL